MDKTTKIFIGVAVLILVIGGIWYFSRSQQQTADLSGPIKIGYIGPLSGPSAVLGMDAIKAIEIAVDDANAKSGDSDRKIKVIAEDDQYLTQKTVDAYNKLVNIDKVKIILVSTYGGVFAIADRAKQDGVLIIDPLDCNSDVAMIDKNVFCLATESESIGHSLADYAISQGKLKAGVLYSTKDNFMSLVKDSFKQRYESGSGKIFEDNFLYTDSDFKTILTKMKANGVNVLVILGHDEQGIIMKQARDLGITAQFLTTGTITSPPAQEAARGNAEGTVFAYWDADANNAIAKDFLQKFIAKVGRGPILPLTTHPAYDTVKLLAEKILPSENENDIAGLKDKILKVKNYQGSTGIINFGSDGAARIKESAWQLVKGVPVKIK